MDLPRRFLPVNKNSLSPSFVLGVRRRVLGARGALPRGGRRSLFVVRRYEVRRRLRGLRTSRRFAVAPRHLAANVFGPAATHLLPPRHLRQYLKENRGAFRLVVYGPELACRACCFGEQREQRAAMANTQRPNQPHEFGGVYCVLANNSAVSGHFLQRREQSEARARGLKLETCVDLHADLKLS